MLCPPLQQLVQLTRNHPARPNPVELVRLACSNCESTEVCPAVTEFEYDARKRDPQARKRNDQD